MARPCTRRRNLVAVAALLPVLVLTACGSSGTAADAEAQAGAAGSACDLPVADSSASLPTGFPAPQGITLYEPSTQGATSIVFGWLAESDFGKVRDAEADALTAAGYEIEGTDQESVEAEVEFKGAHEGTAKVQPLCEGHVSIRFKLNS